MFKRKIYAKMLEWKRRSKGSTALLIEGARRIGKSTIVEAFAKNEYESYILIDFSRAGKDLKDLFEDLSNTDYLFMQLQLLFNTKLIERKSLIIFDEVQFAQRLGRLLSSWSRTVNTTTSRLARLYQSGRMLRTS